MTESEREARERKVWKQEKPACTCTPVNPRHWEGYKCITKEQLAAWWRATSRPGRVVVSDWAKRMAWLWLQFDQDPEAKRLSGRGQKPLGISGNIDVLGGDRWDDAAGMTELEKRMFE